MCHATGLKYGPVRYISVWTARISCWDIGCGLNRENITKILVANIFQISAITTGNDQEIGKGDIADGFKIKEREERGERREGEIVPFVVPTAASTFHPSVFHITAASTVASLA